jgi:hypothetical protein
MIIIDPSKTRKDAYLLSGARPSDSRSLLQSDTELFAGACSYERESGARSILAAGESFFRLTLLWNPICTWNSRVTGRCSNKCVGICDFMRSAKSFG